MAVFGRRRVEMRGPHTHVILRGLAEQMILRFPKGSRSKMAEVAIEAFFRTEHGRALLEQEEAQERKAR